MLNFIIGLAIGSLGGFLLAGLLQFNYYNKVSGIRRSWHRARVPLRDRHDNVTPIDRRRQADRRSWRRASFPLRDRDGNVTMEDRRKQADRRLRNIALQ